MTEPPIDYREELDIIRIDPLALERQRNRYASRGVSLLILLNGAAALVLLASFAHLTPQIENAPKLIAAMLVFGSGAVAALTSMFFAYLRRTVRVNEPDEVPLRTAVWWLATLAAIGSTACFLIGLSMAGTAVKPALVNTTTLAKSASKVVPGPAGPAGPAGPQGEKGEKADQGIREIQGRRERRGIEEILESQGLPASGGQPESLVLQVRKDRPVQRLLQFRPALQIQQFRPALLREQHRLLSKLEASITHRVAGIRTLTI